METKNLTRKEAIKERYDWLQEHKLELPWSFYYDEVQILKDQLFEIEIIGGL